MVRLSLIVPLAFVLACGGPRQAPEGPAPESDSGLPEEYARGDAAELTSRVSRCGMPGNS